MTRQRWFLLAGGAGLLAGCAYVSRGRKVWRWPFAARRAAKVARILDSYDWTAPPTKCAVQEAGESEDFAGWSENQGTRSAA